MNGEQGAEPPPRTNYPSLERAMAAHGIPIENRSIVKQICDAVGIRAYVGYSDHVRAIRAGEGPDLRIYWGWTEGLVDLDEAQNVTGGRGPIIRSEHLGSGQYYVAHPLNRLHAGGGGRPGRSPRPTETCPVHHTSLPATGICDDCA